MELCRANQRVGLTLQEFKVLKFLISRPELVISRSKVNDRRVAQEGTF